MSKRGSQPEAPTTLEQQRRALLTAYRRKRQRQLHERQAWSRIFALHNNAR